MLFSSTPFFIFFAGYLAVHLAVPRSARLPLILVGSTFFYGWWDWRFVAFPYALLSLACVGNWLMSGAAGGRSRCLWLVATVTALLLPLVFFKYARFLCSQVLALSLPQDSFLLHLPLPLGISFVTFTLIGYTVDVYRRRVPRETRLASLAGAVMFFPHLIAGPVVLPRQLLGQLDRPRRGLPVNYLGAVLLFSIGLVKKLVFADQVATSVNPVFNNLGGEWSCLDYWLAVYGFSLQIYCDFSGYSDMALGLGLLLGIKLPTNFDRPYLAASLVEFWQRWHITLSRWLRDYLYIPLGGNRHGMLAQVRNLLITMTLGGLWHGANWTFLLWGLAHGVILALIHLGRWIGLSELLGWVPRWFCGVLTFHLVTLAWVLFRARTLTEAGCIFHGLTLPLPSDWQGFVNGHVFPLVLLGLLAFSHRWDNALRIRIFARKAPAELVWALVCVGWLLALVISAGNSAEFLYFDF